MRSDIIKKNFFANLGLEQIFIYLLAFYVIIDFGIRQFTPLPKTWSGILFVFFILLWVCRWFAYKGENFYRWTPLGFPIITFFTVGLFLLFTNSPDLKIGLEGFRVITEYIFLFFAPVQLLRTPKSAKHFIYALVFVGFLLAIDGIHQYILNVPMPKNWMDKSEIALASSIRTRVFSIVGSPNTLGSFMVLLIPVSISLAYFEQKVSRKLVFVIVAFSMVSCLVFTSSRGAWIGFIVSIAVFAVLVDRRVLIPALICCGIFAVFVPSVRDRISYLLSSRYVASSHSGGRLGRAEQGLQILKDNILMGVGIGRFGGEVAIKNKIPGAFYSDNYYLKIAVETGLLGFSTFIFLLYNVITRSLKVIRSMGHSPYTFIMKGILSGLCGVLVHCLFENVFEYGAMSVYFWLLTGIVMFLGYHSIDEVYVSSFPMEISE